MCWTCGRAYSVTTLNTSGQHSVQHLLNTRPTPAGVIHRFLLSVADSNALRCRRLGALLLCWPADAPAGTQRHCSLPPYPTTIHAALPRFIATVLGFSTGANAALPHAWIPQRQLFATLPYRAAPFLHRQWPGIFRSLPRYRTTDLYTCRALDFLQLKLVLADRYWPAQPTRPPTGNACGRTASTRSFRDVTAAVILPVYDLMRAYQLTHTCDILPHTRPAAAWFAYFPIPLLQISACCRLPPMPAVAAPVPF